MSCSFEHILVIQFTFSPSIGVQAAYLVGVIYIMTLFKSQHINSVVHIFVCGFMIHMHTCILNVRIGRYPRTHYLSNVK